MTRPLLTLLSLALAAGLWAGLPSARAEAQPQAAQRFLESKHDQVMRLLRAKSSASRNAKIDRMLQDLLDYQELAERSLGEHWTERSEQERSEFVELLRKLIERNYKQNLERTLDYEVRYTGAEKENDAVLVRTTARSRENRRAPPVSIDYRLKKESGTWRVFDVVTDGVSMVNNYREQFDGIIDEDGWNGLLDRMRNKLQEG